MAKVPAAHWLCVEFQLRIIDQSNTIDKTVVVGVRVVMDVDHVTIVYNLLCKRGTSSCVDVADLGKRVNIPFRKEALKTLRWDRGRIRYWHASCK